jgi:hypothetical protein
LASTVQRQEHNILAHFVPWKLVSWHIEDLTRTRCWLLCGCFTFHSTSFTMPLDRAGLPAINENRYACKQLATFEASCLNPGYTTPAQSGAAAALLHVAKPRPYLLGTTGCAFCYTHALDWLSWRITSPSCMLHASIFLPSL